MKYLRTLLGEQAQGPTPTNWPDDVVPWGSFGDDPLRYWLAQLM